MLLLFRPRAKSLNAQEERQATSSQLVTRLHLPHTIVAGFSIQDEAMDVAQSAPQGANYRADVIHCLLP